MNSAVVGVLRALLTLDTAQFERGIKKAQDGFKAFSRETKTIGLQATQLGSSLTRTLTLPLAAVGVSVAKAAIDFETSFAGIRKTVDASEAEFSALAKEMRGLAKTIPINVNELNRLGEAAGALGIQKSSLTDFTRVMALLGVTTNVTSAQATESIAQIQTVFQATGKDTERFASTLVDLGNKGASTEHQILELANRIASAGRAVGMSQAEVLGFSSAIANVGIEAEAGGTAISKVFADISMAVSMGGEGLEGFAELAGRSTADFAKLFKEDAASAVVAFIEGLGKAQKAGGDLNLILEDLGFKEVRQARALRDLALSGDNLAKSLRVANTAWRENTALSEEARKRFETTSAKLTLLWNRVKDVAITVGNALLPMIDATIKAFDAFVPLIERGAEAFAKMPVPVQAVAVALGLTAAAAGPLIFIFGQLALSASAVAAAFTKKGLATRGLTGLLGGLNATVTTTTAAFRASAVAVGLFTAALAGIVVPFALTKVAEAIEHIRGLLKDSEQWRLNAISENTAHLNMMAEASRVAGREIKNLAEAQQILKTRITLLQMAQEQGLNTVIGVTTIAELLGSAQDKAAAGATAYQRALKSLQDSLERTKAQVAGLTQAQRREIAAGIELGHSNDEIAKSLNKAFPTLKLTAEAVGMLRDRMTEAGKETKKTAKTIEETAAALRQFKNEIGEREIEDVERANAAKLKSDADYRQFTNQNEEQRIDDYKAGVEKQKAIDAAYRQHRNEVGERMMQDEAERMERLKAHRERFLNAFKVGLSNIGGAVSSNLFSLFLPTGDQGRQAKEEYERLRRSGTASAEAITNAFRRMKEEQNGFLERFKGWTSGILREFARMIDEMLSMFVNELLGGIMRALARSKLGQAVIGWVTDLIPGLSSSIAKGVGTAAASTAAGVGTAAATGTSAMAGTEALAASFNASAAGTTAGTTAGSGGLMSGLATAGTYALPFAIPLLAAWAGGAFKKYDGELLREARSLARRGIPPEKWPEDVRNSALVRRALQPGHSVFDPVDFNVFGRTFRLGEGKLGSFANGGFVPPNVTMPAILHGGSMGEIITPVAQMSNGRASIGNGARSVHFHVSTIDARGIREFVSSKDFTDSVGRVFEDNKGFLTSRLNRALRP